MVFCHRTFAFAADILQCISYRLRVASHLGTFAGFRVLRDAARNDYTTSARSDTADFDF